MNRKFNIWIICVGLCSMFFSSCDKFFDYDTDYILKEDDSYKERGAVYAGMLGLEASFRTVAEHNILLSELLGDLMQPTTVAPDDCWDVFRYKVKSGNKFANPAPYYKLIINCNDFLRHLVAYNKAYPDALTSNVYRGMISSALTYRAWAYLQIGKIYGEAVYYDVAMADNTEKQPGRLMSLDALLEELIYSLKNGIDGVNGYNALNWRLLIDPNATDSGFDQVWNRMSVNVDALLTEIYLWSGDYTNAAKTGINFVSNAGANYYKLNVFTLSWEDLFSKDLNASHTQEALTLVPYSYEQQQTSSLQPYFMNTAASLYYFMPTEAAYMLFSRQVVGKFKDYMTGEETLMRGSDMRKYSTMDYNNGELVVVKYAMREHEYEQDAPVYIYRAAEMYLMIAEALNGLKNYAAADSILNVGLKPSWKSTHYEPPFDAPIYGSSLNVCPGVRGRANMMPDYMKYHVVDSIYTDPEELSARKQFVLDSLIAQETGLELAYEGKRWFTLVRMARNSNMPEKVAVPVSQKFDYGEAQVYKEWLMNPENWFIKWDQTKVLTEE